MATPGQVWIGLMSGTSLDGVDGVAARLGHDGTWQGVLAHAHLAFDAGLRAELLALNTPGPDELHRSALAGQGLARLYAQVVARLVENNAINMERGEIAAIGAHGQTVRHRPELGYTTQLLNGALLAELTGLDVVADFRSRDVAAGGQGAPLVPVFHQAVFSRPAEAVAVLNVGGIANVSLLAPRGDSPSTSPAPPLGFDCGPGNVLMDLWCQQQRGQPFDADGQWAASGQVQPAWLAQALAEPYLALPPPKSTGRDLFHAGWLAQWLARCGVVAAPALPGAGQVSAQVAADVQATLCEFSAVCAAQAMSGSSGSSASAAPWPPRQSPSVSEVLVCGGGALNGHFMRRLAAALNPLGGSADTAGGPTVRSTAERGLPPMQVEAAAFAWLAWATMNRRSGNVPAVTGARGPRVLGAVYPA